ncbi:hypothetical protein [Massilia sp. Dwa41.01b]|uniref:hypothetical protein n=1 Tax=Massilia sp. Dwa41.01b TaxID=2709302 RepID=UPI001E520B7E
MPFFAYKGRNSRGELMHGVLEGLDAGAIADQLFGTGVTPVEIVATRRGPADVAAGGGMQATGIACARRKSRRWTCSSSAARCTPC